MKKLILILTLVVTAPASFSQTQNADEKSVSKVIETLFQGMKLGDSAMVHSTFASEVTMGTVYKDKEGNVNLRAESSIVDFLKAVGTPHKEVWNEEIWDLKIRVDGDFAQGWCNYAFYVDKNFSHCGVDAFEMYRTKDGWKIFHLADTRRKTDCNIPVAVQNKYK
ncbi:nuclear transport factor 2 family protein [Chryseosolibacter indicus]|uniref:Nuclear transport factor 2 family protein n=1 Tax=Chryseosolibacter indicus TaxID=2782351 RepID=A0ABS5VN62_9BACT|nr:nuclear transport factor 2 family protein [Chryseosolibacter indicus]MBT1702275.1 nuclear transport factor 2 family protein [Chryseosolibacter indicus]